MTDNSIPESEIQINQEVFEYYKKDGDRYHFRNANGLLSLILPEQAAETLILGSKYKLTLKADRVKTLYK